MPVLLFLKISGHGPGLKSRIIFTILIIVFASAAASSLRALESSGTAFLGKVNFVNSAEGEILFQGRDGQRPVLLASGQTVHVLSKGTAVRFTVTDISGKYVRCSIYKKMKGRIAEIGPGMDVFDSREINSREKYYDARLLLSSLIGLYRDFIYNIESTDQPEIMAGYVVRFAEDLENMIPSISEINKRYPELGKNPADLPEQIKGQSEALKRLESGLRGVFFKIRIHSSNQSIADASERLRKVLEKMKKGN